MSDYIDRQAAIDALRNRWLKTKNYEGIGEDIAEECEIYLRTVPSAQPQRIRGRWIEDGYNDEKAVCDQCGEPCATYIMGEPRDKYCKWCGADMRG